MSGSRVKKWLIPGHFRLNSLPSGFSTCCWQEIKNQPIGREAIFPHQESICVSDLYILLSLQSMYEDSEVKEGGAVEAVSKRVQELFWREQTLLTHVNLAK
jgi:hypothetical protein